MKLDENVLRKFSLAKEFSDNNDLINALDFSENGESLISSSDDEQIIIYDCLTGVPKKTLHSKKYGCDVIRFTHNSQNAIHGSTKMDDSIRYLSLHDNKYIRYFSGHNKKVVSLCLCPTDEFFISSSLDKSLRVWDLRTPNCAGLMNVTGRAVAAFDPEGLIFAAGISSESIKLYDIKSYDRGPFSTFKIPNDKDVEWTGLKFSPDGRIMMITTNSNTIKLIDAYEGKHLHTLTGFVNKKGIPLEACFSPDSRFIFCGSTDGFLNVWSSDTGNKICQMETRHSLPIQCCAFNPKFMMLATSCKSLSFWVPCIND